VSTQVGGPLDIIENGSNGYLGSNRRLSCLSEKLVQVLTLSDKQWQAMSDAAYATAVQYTWDDATDRFEAALQFACDQSQRVKTANQANTGIPAS
jgi:glycosyltransferase involved in cell wall biosynthesis